MPYAICTLFENDYHYGVAALVNSLAKFGFEGDVYGGYRGNLPHWAKTSDSKMSSHWQDSKTMEVSERINLHFLPLKTDYHLANYKAKFMLQVIQGPARRNLGIAYFDPDIVIKCRWSFFEKWIRHGVALVHEITSNDMPLTHPIRLDWKTIIESNDKCVNHEINHYINSGFIGVDSSNFEFIYIWHDLIESAIHDFKGDPTAFMSKDRTHPFFSIDQDAANIAAMCCSSTLSEMGPEAMDFENGGWTMSHAVGTPKPWRKNYILEAIRGNSPSLADRAFWLNVNGQIKAVHSRRLKNVRISIMLASFFSRFYQRR